MPILDSKEHSRLLALPEWSEELSIELVRIEKRSQSESSDAHVLLVLGVPDFL